jgi:hypothetical protein
VIVQNRVTVLDKAAFSFAVARQMKISCLPWRSLRHERSGRLKNLPFGQFQHPERKELPDGNRVDDAHVQALKCLIHDVTAKSPKTSLRGITQKFKNLFLFNFQPSTFNELGAK